MLHVYIDADACPVKNEVYKVAGRYGLGVTLVANSWMNHPGGPSVRLEVVPDGPDAADDWIVAHVERHDIVITGDIPLAARCLDKGARVLGHKGREFTDANVGDALAGRHLATMLRDQGVMTGGPPPFAPKDRSLFLQKLDELVNAVRREA
ncbi:YaiI/YqxD family protein [bacterium]|nr:YaiI/YqxD family protein [bacterium]